MLTRSEAQALTEIENRLLAQFSERATEVRAAVERARVHFESSTVRDFVPLLVERRVRADLAAG
jgi:hypothetical protein